MTEARNLAFLHGASGPVDTPTWLEPLNHQLARLGYSRFDPKYDRVTAPLFLDDLLAAAQESEPPRVRRHESGKQYQRAKVDYFERLDEIGRVGRTWERLRTGPDASWLPDSVAGDSWMTQVGMNRLKAVRLYQREPRARWSAQYSVLRQLPQSGSIILVAHSLGSVIAVDLLTKLPPSLRIELLLTVGSPLAIGRLGDPGFGQDFPYDRVGAWVNLYDPGDIVTIGRGAGQRFKAACDIAVRTGDAHDVVAYLSNPAAAAVVGHRLFGASGHGTRGGDTSGHGTRGGDTSVQRDLHPAWRPLLLSFAYSAQLSSGAQGEDWLFKSRVDAARGVLAQRTIDDVRAKREKLIGDKVAGLDDSPVGQGRYPEVSDLLHHAASLVRDGLGDDALLSLAVGLAMSPPLHPFDLQISDEKRHEALLNTLHRVRNHSGDSHGQGSVGDQKFAEAVRDGVSAARSAVAEGGFPWGRVLVGGGVVLLALTGVGLAVAAPVGLAGAALVTGTLAAFGPGGMVGGLVTVATLTGLGAATTGIGVGIGSHGDPLVAERALRIAIEELANMPTGPMRNTVASVLAVVDAQARLKFESSAPMVEEILQSALNLVQTEFALHDAIAPGRTGSREWESKIQVLQRALVWLAKTHLSLDPLQKARDEFAEVPESMSNVPPPRRELDVRRYAPVSEAIEQG